MSARDELAKTVFVAGSFGTEADAVADWNLLSERTLQSETRALSAQYRIADAVLAAGYSKPKVLGYIVVDRGGIMVGNQHKHEESAQAFADEWTKDCKDAGIDWDYRVAEITEATA